MKRPRREQYILVLPSLFTTGNLFCGFYSIVRSFNHDFEKAAYAVLLAVLFDVLDGRVARITRSQSKFGVEYDSIADVVSFGVAPAILSYVWVLEGFGRVGWAAAFLFAACAALRLARFNTISEELPKSYFLGLPTPAAAVAISGIFIAYEEIHFPYPETVMLAVCVALGLLMVSNIRYRSFKDFDLRHRRSFFQLVFLVAVIACIAIRHELSLGIITVGYALFGPVREAVGLLGRRFQKKNLKGVEDWRTGENESV
ncbi:MAG: CDP-diacylglycerol--serine O-phosphatidyltransferase [Pseudobdellovibrionaceae bacterium]